MTIDRRSMVIVGAVRERPFFRMSEGDSRAAPTHIHTFLHVLHWNQQAAV
jgi:hypothetical protein